MWHHKGTGIDIYQASLVDLVPVCFSICEILKQPSGLMVARVEMDAWKHVYLNTSDDFASGEVSPEQQRSPWC